MSKEVFNIWNEGWTIIGHGDWKPRHDRAYKKIASSLRETTEYQLLHWTKRTLTVAVVNEERESATWVFSMQGKRLWCEFQTV